MELLVNGTTLNALTAYTERDFSTIVLKIIVSKEVIGYEELKALFTGDFGSIVSETDTFSGFSHSSITEDDECFIVKLSSDEQSFQIGRNRQLETDNANLANKVQAKDIEISELSVKITENENLIADQKEKINTLKISVASKDAEITELLTIAEEYADMLYQDALNDLESEVL